MAAASETRDLRPATRQFTQARGEARRKLLFDTALALLRERHVEDITYQEIARHAGIPLASCYHFFPGKMELLAALIDNVGPWFTDVSLLALKPHAESWTDILDRLVDVLADHYNTDLAFAQLFSAWKIPRSVYPAHDAAFQEAAERFAKAIDRQFVRSPIENEMAVFAFAFRLIDAALVTSLEMHSQVTPFMREEGKRAARSYLANYLPPVMQRRDAPSAEPDSRTKA
ncbi:TetR/AcrR family transcriptional regulator [Sphingosinicella soli]|uniref:AcrR family transcriptional regulator n=1 Tax=Sphingosinicella soli TaxID=333708 RepID=A0A7W7B503_9SPHN|nr:TetR/AcrR family transcriptional regulator [Sphingosinicella soli]MBB4633258.1 AcrR family transcriptional regulator [Sphingosinicella soli]